MDRENVIKELKDIRDSIATGQINGTYKMIVTINYAIEMLKEQEAVAPEKEHSGSGITWWNVCGNCKTAINPNDKYCHECGQAVKWE